MYINDIVECKKGYFGDSCNEPCPQGSFGFKCGGKCLPNCTNEECHHNSGCPNDKMKTQNPLKRGPSLKCNMLPNTMAYNIFNLFIYLKVE